jgi:hypothetical protein
MDRTSVFNNAGVGFCQAGRLDVAQDMFLAALEETLLFARDAPEEQEQQPDQDATSGRQQQQQQQRRVTPPPPCVITAENHLANMAAILSSRPTATTNGTQSLSSRIDSAQEEEEEEVSSENTPPPPTALQQANNQQRAADHFGHEDNNENQSNRTTTSRPYRAYLYTEPISLQANNNNTQNDENNITSLASPIQLIGAVVVFNLALVHHLRNSSSIKARQFYEISQALLDDALQALGGGGGNDIVSSEGDNISPDQHSDANRCTLLQVALTNNFGVWLYENGHLQAASESLQRLVAMATAFGPILPVDVRNGVNANIRHYVQASLNIASPVSASTTGKTLTPAW